MQVANESNSEANLLHFDMPADGVHRVFLHHRFHWLMVCRPVKAHFQSPRLDLRCSMTHTLRDDGCVILPEFVRCRNFSTW